MDPRWRGGDYYDAEPGDGPHEGLAIARMMSMMTFRSDDVFTKRFGREVVEPVEGFTLWQRFEVERYIEYQGDKLVRRFDANSYLLLTKAMDLHDLGRGRGGMEAAFARLRAPLLSVGIVSDILYPPHQSREIVSLAAAAGVPAVYAELDSPHGHDAFLIEVEPLTAVVARLHRPTRGRRTGCLSEHDDRPRRAAILGGRTWSGDSLAPVLFPSTTYEVDSVDDHRQMAGTARPAALLLPLRQPHRAGVRGGGGVAGGGRGGAGLGVGHGRGHRAWCSALCSSGDHVVVQRQLFSVTSTLFTAHCPASAST